MLFFLSSGDELSYKNISMVQHVVILPLEQEKGNSQILKLVTRQAQVQLVVRMKEWNLVLGQPQEQEQE